MRGLTRSRTRLIILLAVIALLLGFASNFALGLQSHRNCQSIELIKANTRSILVESYDDLVAGKNDEVFRRLYGNDWVEKKGEAIDKANHRLHKFDPDECRWIIR